MFRLLTSSQSSTALFAHVASVPIILSNLALARMAFEDAYLTVQDVDGQLWADKLRYRMHGHSQHIVDVPDEQSWLFQDAAIS
jgi:hypothetical protein